MSISTFKRAEAQANAARTLVYGPVAAGVTAIVFSGTFANVDSATSAEHWVTLEVLNSSASYVPRLFRVPIPYGGTSKCPKTVLQAGESLYVTADVPNAIQAVVDVLERI